MSLKTVVLAALMAVVLAGLGVSGCRDAPATSGAAPAVAEPATARAKPSTSPRLDGEVFARGERKRVVPFITHPPDMDLRNQCRHAVDDAKKAADKQPDVRIPPLCFDPEMRPASAMKVLRVEFRAGMATPEALAILRTADEGVHFLVEATGSLYQTLDVAYAARRDGVPRGDEIRVLSGDPEGQAKLVAALTGLYPGLQVIEVAAPPKPAKVKAAKGGTQVKLPMPPPPRDQPQRKPPHGP